MNGSVKDVRPGPTRGRCPRCGSPVLVAPDGQLFQPEPHSLAITRPDGTRLTPTEAAYAATGRIPPIGHHPHRPDGYGCERPEQLALFES